MNYTEIISALEQASAFDLYRLSMGIDNMIDDPRRIIEIKSKLHLGQEIEFYEPRDNRVYQATLEQMKQTKAVVRTHDDGRRWSIPLCSINIHQQDTVINQSQGEGLTRNELQVGDWVAFMGKDGVEHSGQVQRLNQKTVTIISEHTKWRVSYPLLHKVIDVE